MSGSKIQWHPGFVLSMRKEDRGELIFEKEEYHMEYLVVELEDEIFYKLTEVNGISYNFAENVLNEAEMMEKDVKPLETVAVIAFENGDSEAFSTVGLKMHFDK